MPWTCRRKRRVFFGCTLFRMLTTAMACWIHCIRKYSAGMAALATMLSRAAAYPATSGTNLYVGNPSSITLVNMVTLQVKPNYATGFEFLSGMTLDPSDLSLYVADDPAAGKLPAQGRWFYVGNGPANGGRGAGTL